ncbi:hypothetical protein NP233_g8089 [Leucocoprinus birnbaumii]|uniref:SDR family oxidoreductase n=1 Tax=Leucocoprinus birnbaumii TaxID=56174 RepID=A0AAD5VRG7_9AGAR|nr:hypothetical protein NP233_g8089 [Leucocoprinus birnbaumii]
MAHGATNPVKQLVRFPQLFLEWFYPDLVIASNLVNHLTSALALKLGPHHITVNAILPGLFPSKMTAFGIRKTGEEAFNASQPTGRFGRPEDIAGLALFLASPASAHITGTHTLLDGGARYRRHAIAPATKL